MQPNSRVKQHDALGNLRRRALDDGENSNTWWLLCLARLCSESSELTDTFCSVAIYLWRQHCSPPIPISEVFYLGTSVFMASITIDTPVAFCTRRALGDRFAVQSVGGMRFSNIMTPAHGNVISVPLQFLVGFYH